MKKLLLSFVCIIVILTGCDSDKDSGPSGSKGFLEKTEWVGVLDRAGYQFPPPASLRFKADSKLVLYAPLFFIEGDKYIKVDSVNGAIATVTEPDSETIEVKAVIEHYGDITMTIKNRKNLTATSTNASKPVPFTLELYDTPLNSMSGSIWSGPIMSGSGPTNGMVAYPDLSPIVFDRNITYYIRNGVVVPRTNTPQSPELGALEVAFQQRGAMISMMGFNESGPYLIPYFGVLLPGNKKMMVYSETIGNRLPYYTQTIPWYGTIGQTPIIERK